MNWLYLRRRWIHAVLLILLGADIVVYLGWVRNPVLPGGVNRAQVAELEQVVAAQAAEVARLRRIEGQAPQLRPRLEQFISERFLEGRTGFSHVAEELEEAARPAAVRLGRVSYESEAVEEEPALERLLITTSVEGRYANLLRYLEALERSQHFYLIDELGVAGTRPGQLRLEMRLATYFRRGRT